MTTSNVELLPLPEWGGAQIIPDNLIKDYARACVEANTKYYRDMLCQSQDDVMKLRDETEALRAEVDRAMYEASRWKDVAQSQASWELLWSEEKDRAERLAEALRGVLPFVATQAVGCHGDKCREEWCYSCNGEEEADEAAQRGREAYRAALAAQPQGEK